MKNAKLEAKVEAQNRVNAYANELYNKLLPIFAPLVGQKITKQNGGFLNKILKLIPNLATDNIEVEIENPVYWLAFTVTSTEPVIGSDDRMYAQTSLNMADLSDNKLVRIRQSVERRVDFDAEEIADKREEINRLESRVDVLTKDIRPFGLHDD